MINTIFQNLLREAQVSPMLLSDLAGLETYISESYSNRSFIELLQNADDAGSTKFLVQQCGQLLLIANNGRIFNSADIESLCRSASSTKVRGNSIGYRGIGFKSVVSIAHEVHLISGDYEITFSRELTKKLIPDASKVPLIRIPHPLRKEIKAIIRNDIENLKRQDYTTFFIFSGVNIKKVIEEYSSFQRTSLLFLNNIQELNINFDNNIKIRVLTCLNKDNSKQISIVTSDIKTEWRLYSAENCSIAFSIKDNQIVRLPENEALIHAFLPTEDSCGLGVIINADFSTDPSRRHLIYDEITNNAIKDISKLYVSLLNGNLFSLELGSEYLIKALIPYFDIRIVNLTKNSFEKVFASKLRDEVGTTYSSVILAPTWLNVSDFSKLQIKHHERSISERCLNIAGIESFMKYLGCKQDCIMSILNKVKDVELSILGYAQLVSAAMRQILMNNKLPSFVEIPMFLSENNRRSLSEINKQNLKIDDSFIQLILDNGITYSDIRICLQKLSLVQILKNQFSDGSNLSNVNKNSFITQQKSTQEVSHSVSSPDNKSYSFVNWYHDIQNKENSVQTISVAKRWRSAEENTLSVLNSNGFNLHDVSTQNIGYDLEGIDPNGESIYVEVKSLNYTGQRFHMTNNEFAVAQYKQNEYYLALVIQTQEQIKIGLIKNPINSLKLNRQCVQWIWECSEYNYDPIVIDL
mgnify:CR=1 FL=1